MTTTTTFRMLMLAPTYIRVAADSNCTAPASVSKLCIHCEEETIFLMSTEEYTKWQIQNLFVQNVFPHLDAETREWMISGTHPHCWEEVFGKNDQEEEYF